MLEIENIIEFDVSDTNVIFDNGNKRWLDCDVEDDKVVSNGIDKDIASNILCGVNAAGNSRSDDPDHHRYPRRHRYLLVSGMLLQQLRLLLVICTGLVNIKLCQK